MERPLEEHWMPEQHEAGLFSVIIPTYNRAHLLAEALDSVWAQTYRPIEVIVVDDGSLDNTQAVVSGWAKGHTGDGDFRVGYYAQENRGPSAARNRGLLESHGEFLQFLDSDDRLHSQRLEKLAAIFHDPQYDLIITGSDEFCDHCGAIIARHYGNPNQDQLLLALEGRLWVNTLCPAFRRSLSVATGPWNEEFLCFEDCEYVTRALFAARKSVALREIMASARHGGRQRLSHQVSTYQGRAWQILFQTALRDGMQHRPDIPHQARQAFASRLYALGILSNARGWPDLGEQCSDLAKSIKVELNREGKRRRLAYRSGKWGGRLYIILSWVKQVIRHAQPARRAEHICCKHNGVCDPTSNHVETPSDVAIHEQTRAVIVKKSFF